MGIGDNPAIKLLCAVRTAFTGGTSLQVQFQGAPDNGSGAPGTYTTYAESAVVLEADLIVGRYLLPIDVPRPPPGAPNPRFCGCSTCRPGRTAPAASMALPSSIARIRSDTRPALQFRIVRKSP